MESADAATCFTRLLANNQDKPWSYRRFSQQGVPIATLRALPHLPWDWSDLSVSMPVTDIVASLELPWSWPHVSNNRGATPEFKRAHPLLAWAPDAADVRTLSFWQVESRRADLTLDYVLANIDKPWDFNRLSMSTVAPWAWEARPDKPWHMDHLSYDVPLDMVMRHPEAGWCYTNMFFTGIPRAVACTAAAVAIQRAWRAHNSRRRAACEVIQSAFLRSSYDPDFARCRKRLRACARNAGMAT